jgi:hypothetical protein
MNDTTAYALREWRDIPGAAGYSKSPAARRAGSSPAPGTSPLAGHFGRVGSVGRFCPHQGHQHPMQIPRGLLGPSAFQE